MPHDAAPSTPLPPPAARGTWFPEARFGMFVHYGLYSLLGRGEWAMFNERIPLAEYAPLARSFSAERFDADALAALAVDAGMRYLVFTAKHHDGFCLWPSRTTAFTIANSACRRDLVGDVVAACRRRGLRVGLYLSDIDWRYPGYFDPVRHPDSARAMVDLLHAQTDELLTSYGPIDVLWYDGDWIDHGRCTAIAEADFWRSQALLARIRELQPDCLVNSRLGIPGDFDTPEGHIAASAESRLWETCMTIGDAAAWGWSRWNPNRKSLGVLLHLLTSAVAYGGGNLLLNIGPQPDGSPDPEDAAVLRSMGAWLHRGGGESIYGAAKFARGSHKFAQGLFTLRGRTLYAHLHRYSAPELTIPLLSALPRRCRLLGSPDLPLTAELRSNRRVVIRGLPAEPPHPCQNTIALEFDEDPFLIDEPDHAAWITGAL